MATGLCKSDPARVHYERHRPENTALYRLVQDHAETFFAQVEAETAHGLSDYVKTEFNAFLDCGILANGFLRLQCGDCHHEKIVAFSCKKRGFWYHLVDGHPVFRPVSPPTEEQLQILLHQLIQRIMKCLTAEGFLTEDEGVFYMSDRSRTSMCFAAPARPCAMKQRPPIHRLPHCRLPPARTALHWARVRDKKS